MSFGEHYFQKILILNKLKIYEKFGVKNKYFRGEGGCLSVDREQLSVKAHCPDFLYCAPVKGNSMQKPMGYHELQHLPSLSGKLSGRFQPRHNPSTSF
jgi:hypothetical protein